MLTAYELLLLTITVAILGVIILLAARRQTGSPVADYEVFLLLGLTWLVIGLASDNFGLGGLGAIFFIIGLSRRYQAS